MANHSFDVNAFYIDSTSMAMEQKLRPALLHQLYGIQFWHYRLDLRGAKIGKNRGF